MIYSFLLLALAVVLILFAIDVLLPKLKLEYGLRNEQKINSLETPENSLNQLEIK